MVKDYIEFQGLRLCLKTKEKMQLEELIGNPLQYIFSLLSGDDDAQFELPPLKIMVTTIHVAAQRYEHKMSKEKIIDIIDEYLDQDEKSVVSLFSDVFLQLLIQGKYLPSQDEEVVEEKPVEEKPVKKTKAKAE